MKLLISVATRNRPEKVVDTLQRSLPNIQHPDTRIVILADADDTPTIEALAKEPWNDKRVSVNVAEREDTIGGKYNRSLKEIADVYMVSADDDPQITPGYDIAILEAAARFDDGLGWICGRLANLTFPSSLSPTARMVEKLGYIWPEYFPFWFADHWILDLAKITGRMSWADINTDQSKVGTTQELREPAWWATWFDAAYLKRRKEAHNIIDSNDFHASDGQREILFRQHHWIEQYSRWVNDSVRQQARQLEMACASKPADDRYKRVKQKAVELVPHLLNDFAMDPGEAMMFRNLLIPPRHVVSFPRAYG